MDHVIGHVVRRGLDAHSEWRAASHGSGDDKIEIKVPAYVVAILCSTVAVALVTLTLTEYTYAKLIPALAMIESPTAILFESVPENDPDAPIDSKKGDQVDVELVVVKQQPITAKFRTTLKHLRARAGTWSRFRAISMFTVYAVGLAHLTIFFRRLSIPRGLDSVLASVLLARLQMGWTHVAISDPSPKFWFRRLPSWKLWKKVAIPTAILASAQQVSILLPKALACTLGLKHISPEDIVALKGSDRNLLVFKGLSVFLVSIFCSVAIVIPAIVALTRVQASLLTEEEETIVPFDRAFGGRVVPAILGGSGAIGTLDAWRTFDWNSRVRLLKIYGKAIIIQISLALFFMIVLATEVNVLMGDEIRKYIKQGMEKY